MTRVAGVVLVLLGTLVVLPMAHAQFQGGFQPNMPQGGPQMVPGQMNPQMMQQMQQMMQQQGGMQPGGPMPPWAGQGGPGMGMGMGMGMPPFGGQGMMGLAMRPSVPPVMMVVDGIVYIAFEGKLTAFDAKTLERIAEATYWERPERGPQPGGGPVGPGFPGGAEPGPATPAEQ